MHSLNLTQETLKLLMQVKRVLKNQHHVSVHLESEDFADQLTHHLESEDFADQLTQVIAYSHDEGLYNLACELWDELGRSNTDRNHQTDLMEQREYIEQAWHDHEDTVH